MRKLFRNNRRFLLQNIDFCRKKIILILLIFGMFPAASANAQDNRITLQLEGATLSSVFDSIEAQTSYHFFYNKGVVNDQRQVNIKVEGASIYDVLHQLLQNDNVEYSMVGNNIVLAPKQATKNRSARTNQPAERTVRGRVLDTEGESIPGVSVLVRGTTRGTTTDLDGYYTLEGISSQATLVFSFIGMRSEERYVGDRSVIDVVLQSDLVGLDEVVVIGYGTQRRALVTSAISRVEVDETTLRNVLSPSQLLEGRVAGVSVSTGSGNLGAAERMTVRGIASISASNEPLYVVDGIPINNTNAQIFNFGENMSSLASLNLRDIESIEILKDAASAAIYGSRANNGVVIITTRS